MPRLSRKRNLRVKRKSFKSKRRVVKKRISKRKRKMRGGANQPKWMIEAHKLVYGEDGFGTKFESRELACEAIKNYAKKYLKKLEWYEAFLKKPGNDPCENLFEIRYLPVKNHFDITLKGGEVGWNYYSGEGFKSDLENNKRRAQRQAETI